MNCLFWFFFWSSKCVHHFYCSAVWQFLCVFHGTIAIHDWNLESLKGIQSKHASWLQNVWIFWSLFCQYLGKGCCFCFVFTLNLSFPGHSHIGSVFQRGTGKGSLMTYLILFPHTILVHDISGADCLVQNGSPHSHVLMTSIQRSLVKNCCVCVCWPVLLVKPVTLLHSGYLLFNPLAAPACKISGMIDARTHLQTVYFLVL